MSTEDPLASVTPEQLEAWFQHDKSLLTLIESTERRRPTVTHHVFVNLKMYVFGTLSVVMVVFAALNGFLGPALVLGLPTAFGLLVLLADWGDKETKHERKVWDLKRDRRRALARYHPEAHAALEKIFRDSFKGGEAAEAFAALDPEVQQRMRDVYRN